MEQPRNGCGSRPDTPRREFLKQAGGTALTTSLFTGNVKGANDRIAIGFIGVGVMGSENLKAAIKQPGVQAAAVCDVYQPNLERATAMARLAGHQPREFRDFRQLLADKSIDAVCISTPDHWHPYMSVAACKAGKDVYVEKPACLSLNEGLAMVQAARKYNRVVQAGTWQRSGLHFQKACELVRSGVIGTVSFVRTWIYNNQPQAGIGNPPDAAPPPGLDWDLWLGPAPARPFNPNRFGVYPDAYSYFRFFWDYAGGHLTDSGIHMLDIVQMAFGEAMPKAVTALGGKYWLKDNSETPDTMQVTFDYGSFLGSWEHRNNNTEGTKARLMGITFHGTEGMLYVDRSLFRLTPEPGSRVQGRQMKLESDPHPLHWANFIDCIRTRKRPNSDIETCVRSSETCLLGNAAYRAASRLDWDDERQKVSQVQAFKYLYREYRKPWTLDI
ncbi:MAG: Gfo/Idh/MocA family oxidoreductase [Bryobacteraceae bacterium]|nr:Gfo/Idh/MocA family oxidoreductase [Bryobacteraceae bacterium]